MSDRVAGCVVLYNPDDSVTENIMTYAADLGLLIIVDNSPVENNQFAKIIAHSIPHIHYQWLGKNKGIACALNIACGIALERGFEWLLTMDQDSRFHPGGSRQLISRIEKVGQLFSSVGIISASHNVHAEASLKEYVVGGASQSVSKDYSTVRLAMTSGNLLHLKRYTAVGPFADKLFIDHVDHEYCLRLRKAGHTIVQVNQVSLDHALGNFEIKSFLGRRMKVSHHNPLRRYYMTRNGLYVARHYFSVDRMICLDIWKNIFFFDMVKIVLFERQKLLKLKSVIVGMYHFLINRYGQYELRK